MPKNLGFSWTREYTISCQVILLGRIYILIFIYIFSTTSTDQQIKNEIIALMCEFIPYFGPSRQEARRSWQSLWGVLKWEKGSINVREDPIFAPELPTTAQRDTKGLPRAWLWPAIRLKITKVTLCMPVI